MTISLHFSECDRCTAQALSSGSSPDGLEGLRRSQPQPSKGSSAGNGTFWLLLINAVLFALDHVLHVPQVQSLYLWHSHPRWWQVGKFSPDLACSCTGCC